MAISSIMTSSFVRKEPQHTAHGLQCTMACISKPQRPFLPPRNQLHNIVTTQPRYQQASVITITPGESCVRPRGADTNMCAPIVTNATLYTGAKARTIPGRDLSRTDQTIINSIHSPTTSNQSQMPTTPVIISKLQELLQGYDPELTQYIINGFTHGFHLHADHIQQYPPPSKNSAIATRLPEAVDEKIAKELRLRHIAGPFTEQPFTPMFISPLSLRPKDNNTGWRLLHDLSYPYDDTSVNSSIPEQYKHVSYSSVQDAISIIQSLGTNIFLGKSDIASAFTLVPIHPSDHHLLGFKWRNHYYYYTTLPQGAASSCFIFERIATALQWILVNKFKVNHIIHYLDDFLFLGTTAEQCMSSMHTFQDVCAQIGVPINYAKTEGPSNSLSFLGIRLDTSAYTASLPMDKVTRYKQLMLDLLDRKTCTLREMLNIIGSLQFTTSVVQPGRTFLRRMINTTIGVKKLYHHIHITRPVKDDMQLWCNFLDHYNGVTLFLPQVPTTSAELNLHTDSCPQGFGGTFRTNYFYGTFPPHWQGHNICVLELFPILLALQLYTAEMSNQNIVIYSDNQAVVEVLNKKTTKHPPMLSLLRKLILHCLHCNILITSKHIPGKLNVLPDALSRNKHTISMLQEQTMDLQPTPIPTALQPQSYRL